MELTEKGQKTVKAIRNAVIFIVILAAGYFAYTKWISKDGKLSVDGKSGKPDLTVAYNTFTGVEGLVLMNGGMEPNENSTLYKNYGIKLLIKQMDAVKDTRAGLHSGDLDLVYCTTDALSVEMGSGSELLADNVVQIMQVNQSHGADAIVVRKGIDDVNSLKHKKIAYAVGTASHTLLLNVLESSGLKMSDIDGYQVADGVEAANAFKNNQCDAAVVWAPDDEDCVASQAGAKVLVSSAVASLIIADGLLVKQSVLKAKHDRIVKLVKAWLEGNSRVNTDPTAKKEANALFAKGFKFPEDIAAKSADKVYFSTLGDNINFFGLNSTYTGMTGERMYGRMAIKYTEVGLAKSPSPWRNVSDPSVIQELMNDKDFSADSKQGAAKVESFKPATAEIKKQTSQSSKVISLEFETNSSLLNQDDKILIDREIKELAQGFAGAYIRVEGNTDNVGSAAINDKLSLSRAATVVNYLVNEHNFDRNKFIIVGNGSGKPVSGCEANQDDACRAKNRRTEFQFIWDKNQK
ncbi:MAG: OmpA/MotB domain protein [Sediminibacterium sp.]|nr:OmpA/MotB domain protein [Sediminibacterium sp.]